MQIEDLNALLTEKNALVSQLTEQIATLGQEIADLQKALNEETEIRNTEKATNEQTIADAQAGEQAVSQALTFLKDFYAGAKQSLLQQAPPPRATSASAPRVLAQTARRSMTWPRSPAVSTATTRATRTRPSRSSASSR